MSASFQLSPRHKFAAFAETNHRAKDLLTTVLPQYPVLVAIAARARALALETRNATPAFSWPATAEDFNDDWIEHEIARRRAITENESRLSVFNDIEHNVRCEIHDLIDDNATALITALAQQFDNLLDRLADAVAELGEHVHTAADAITAGTTQAWKQIAEMVAEYQDIRTVQTRLYRGCTTVAIDELRCGDQNPAVTNPEARVYFHSNIATIAPNWQGGRTDNGAIIDATYPWPTGPIERLVWLVRSDSGMWCPTPAELRDHLTNAPAAPLPATPDRLMHTEVVA
ncbi:hypothetical protein NJB1604_02120 [Mycobacterium marinum]|uniref:hypothetical protein n=1 Tax=Mycobacterium marinum TaxID=1781 RepID=UPI0021C3A488|nr:hypothetical protein [Mycobacterium marinum]GJO37402.1 hypothetical protein NJB1604_02120 [Mycobacterium marinum]